MLDRNKTDLTCKVTALAAAYLDGAGCKPIESEVLVAKGWISDLATFIYPSLTETKNMRLIERLRDWKSEELAYNELHYRHGFPLTIITEVKTSIQDFKKDIATKFCGMLYPAHLCYIAYPFGMIEQKDIPLGWIGIEMTKDAERVYRVRKDVLSDLIHPQPVGNVIDLIARVAIRRDSRTRYAAKKALMQAYRANRSFKKHEN